MKHRVLFALLLTAALAAPLAAGELLIPLTAGVAADGTAYTTRVWITNTGDVAQRWTYSFIAPGADGTKAAAGRSITVAPGATVLATNLAPAGRSGMLLVNGAPQLLVTARLEAVGRDGSLRAATPGPLVGSLQTAQGEETLHLHGLQHRRGGQITDLYVINASRQPAQCGIGAFRADGSRIAAERQITLPPLSLHVFERALAHLGAAGVANARFAVSCDQAFYAYSRVYKPGSAELNIMTPSQAVDLETAATAAAGYPVAEEAPSSVLDIESVSEEAVAADGAVEFAVNGQFLNARRGRSYKAYDVPLQAGVAYKRATVEFDFYLNRWQTPLFHGITSLRRTGDRRTRVLYYGLILRGSKGFKSILDIGKDPRTGEGEIHKSNTGPWRPRTNYHVRMDYDLEVRQVTLTVSRNGQVVQTMAGDINNLDLSTDSQRTVRLDFGQEKVGDGAYFPPLGSVFSNLRATFVPW